MAKSFKCNICGKTFAMAMHLGRHRTAVHGVGGKKTKAKTAAAKTAKRKRGRPRGSGRKPSSVSVGLPAISGAPTEVIRTLMNYQAQLQADRDRVEAQLDALSRAIEAMGAVSTATRNSMGARRRGRPVGSGGKRKGKLADYIVKVLGQAKKPMKPREISAAVLKAGYPTKSKNLTRSVSNALPTIKGIKKVGFGQYIAR